MTLNTTIEVVPDPPLRCGSVTPRFWENIMGRGNFMQVAATPNWSKKVCIISQFGDQSVRPMHAGLF